MGERQWTVDSVELEGQSSFFFLSSEAEIGKISQGVAWAWLWLAIQAGV